MSWLSGYSTRKKITIDNTKIDDTLSNFPVLIKLTSSNFDFSKANSDGYDIRFTSSDGETLLKYERERHDSTNSLAEYWVKVTSISSSSDTDIYIYYRTTDTADGADPENVWTSGYAGVWHMKDATTSTILDSTANNNDGTKMAANTPVEADAVIAKGQLFADEYISIEDSASLDITSNLVVEAIWKTPATFPADWQTICMKDFWTTDGATVATYGIFYYNYGTTHTLRVVHEGLSDAYTSYTITLEASTTYHIAFTYIGGKINIYINGVNVSSTSKTGSINTNAQKLYFGRSYRTSLNKYYYELSGTLDEIRIASNAAMTDDWLLADYHSCFDTLLTVGSEETPAASNTSNFFYFFN